MRFIAFIALFGALSTAHLLPRDSTPQCAGLNAESNNGDRKIAIVIDTSGSMATNDPNNLRLAAGKSVLDWLITKAEATGGKKEDLVTVVMFSSAATLEYPLGDPANAYSAVARTKVGGGTYIAGGVEMAIAQLTASGTGVTADRSGIVVFTDGEDSYPDLLVNQINNATKAGIRVSFGYLTSSIYQDIKVQGAIINSGGSFFTVSAAKHSNTFVNGIFVNGLTKHDNPSGDKSILLAGLDASHYITGSETQTLKYNARKSEVLLFTVQSVDAGDLDVQIKSGKKVLASGHTSYSYETFSVTSPGDGEISVGVTAKNAAKDSIFIVGVESNLPTQNCTVGVGKPSGGRNKAAAIGGGVGGGLAGLALVLVGGYYLWKCCHAPHAKPQPGPGNGVPVVPPMIPPPSNKNMSEIPGHGSPTTQPPPSYSPNDMPHNPGYPSSQGLPGQPFPPSQPLQSIPPGQPGHPTSAGYPGHPSPTGPQNQPPQQDHYPDHSPDIDSGSEYEDVPDQDDNLDQDPNDPHDPSQDPHDPHHKKPYRRIQRVRIYGNNHHHHLAPDHPCYTTKCPIASSDHRCDNANHPCTCVDPKCKLNSRLHFCSDDKADIHRCPGPKRSKNCPLMDPPYAEKKKKEHAELVRKYMAQDFAKSGVKSAATYGIRALAM